MKVLIVGASGFIGKNFILSAPKNWEIIGLYNSSKDFKSFLNKNKLSNVSPIQCDLGNIYQVQKAFGQIGHVDICLFLAANTNVRSLSDDPTLDLQTNILPMINFLQNFSGDKLIFFSSGAVYMGLSGAISPSSNINPTIPYAISKFTCEQYIKFYHASKKTFKHYVIIRFFGAYGPYEPERKVSTKLLEVIKSKKECSFTVFGDGRNYIDFMYIDDTIRGILSIIESDKADLTIDLCSGNPLTINELVQRVGKTFGKEIIIKHEGNSPEYITFYASPVQTYCLFGFKPLFSIEEGFKIFNSKFGDSH